MFVPFWNTIRLSGVLIYLLKDIDLVEQVQRTFSRRISGLETFSYPDRLDILGLDPLEYRRIVNDLILTYKIVRNKIELAFDDFFEFSGAISNRGHSYKLRPKPAKSDIRLSFFSYRVINVWNKLDQIVVDSPSIKIFKKRLQQQNKADVFSFCKGRGIR